MKHQRAAALLDQGLRHHEKGEIAAAREKFGQALALDRTNADAWYLDGLTAHLLGEHETAIERISRAVALRPDQPFYHLNLGSALQSAGRKDDAERALRRCIALAPTLAAAHNNLGNLLLLAGRQDEAIACYDRTLVLDPSHAGATLALARLLFKRGAVDPAHVLARRALAQRPDDPEVLNLVGAILNDKRRHAEAIELLDRALASRPDDIALLTNKGNALFHSNRFAAALAVQERVLELRPDDLLAAGALAGTLTSIGRPGDSCALLQALLDRTPGEPKLYSQYLFDLNYTAAAQAELLAAHRAWDTRNASHPLWSKIPGPRAIGSRLRVGFVSADFKEHSVARFLGPLIEHLDRSRFEVFAYSATQRRDANTERLRARFDVFREIADLDDEPAARRIREDGIDILIDLSGHTSDNRLPVFALRPAPVQATWLGYPNTTGLQAIDFRISDAIADPPGDGDAWNSEAVLRLPECFHCFSPDAESAVSEAPPSSRSGAITFASFNVAAKISGPTLSAWAAILARVPDARLLVKSACLGEQVWADLLRDRAAAAGIDPRRLDLRGHVASREAHLAMYREVDIALDTFPYNGTTTTCEALWMGVPVVGVLGDRHSARVGASLLGAVGLGELVAPSVEGYTELAVELAGDAPRLARLRASLRDRMRASPLMDGPRFARHFGAALEDAWRRRCAGADT